MLSVSAGPLGQTQIANSKWQTANSEVKKNRKFKNRPHIRSQGTAHIRHHVDVHSHCHINVYIESHANASIRRHIQAHFRSHSKTQIQIILKPSFKTT